MKKILLLATMLLTLATGANAQRTMDKLDRGLVAVPSGGGTFVSWRIFGEEYYDTEYNLYRDGVKINDKPLHVSNFTDAGGKASSQYQVAAVVRGVEQAKCNAVSRSSVQYKQFAVKSLYSRRGTNITSDYNINDIALADVNGDGVSEFILKRNYGPDGSSVANDSAYNCLECYTINGDRLWWIDLGPNMVSGPDEQYDAVGYDWDGDGKAEVLLRGADNMIIHHSDGTTTNIGDMNVNTRNTVLQTANMTYTNTGAEYLLYLEGATGKPYSIGSGSTPLWIDYPLPRGNADDWGDGYGHRSMKHYFGAPFLDGRHPFIFLGRGCYTKHHMKAFTVNPTTHKLTQYWEWKGEQWPYHGQGYHNFGIADVDWDGRDEICFGSMVIDDNGKGLHTTGFGHGDAQHCSDFDPYRHGQEIFACNEDSPAMNYRNGTTGKIYYRLQSTSDDGRALCGNFSNDYPGAMGHSSQSGTISCVADKVISGGPGGFTNNFRIYWDGDLLEEGLDGANSREGAARVFKADGSIVFTADGTANCNWTKNTPSATGDVLGDWREEIIVRTSDNNYVRIYTTNIPTQWRNYTLWHDHQYRQGMVWESMGYNQPPHASYFLGELEGITIAPPPLTMTGRNEVANNGTIGSANDDQHVIVCETNDTKINVAEGAKPYMVTFNVPSWVQGTNSTKTDGTGTINRKYYKCDVSGAAFTGSMRLVKQGDGTLNLPNTNNTYTGETNIWAGTVNFDGKLPNSPVWLNRFAELNSDGGEFLSIKMEYDSKLRPGRADNKGTLTVDTLKLGFGSRVVFDIYNDLSADQIITKVLTIETKSWKYGPAYKTPVFEFKTHLNTGEEIALGRYHLGKIEKMDDDISKIRIEGIDNKKKSMLTVENGELYLDISGMRDASEIVWNGDKNNNWDLGETENFINANDVHGGSDIFVTGDKVRFDDTASSFTVNMKGELEADTILVDNTKNYTFGGTGKIIGKTALVKQGTGLLTINNEHTFTGNIRISGGAVEISSLANDNKANGNLGGVRAAATYFLFENGGELRTTAAVTNGSPIRMEGEIGGAINNSADFIVDKAIYGTRLVKRGNGWMKLNTSNPSLEKMVIASGTVQCINASVPAKTIEYAGGVLRENAGTSYAINVPKGKTGSWYMANRAGYTNKITGEGTLTIYCTTEKGTNYYATRTPIECNFSDFDGTIIPESSLDDSPRRFTMNMSGAMPKGTMNIPEGVEVQNNGRVYHIGKLAGKGSLGGSCAFSNGGSVGANTWRVGNDESFSTTATVVSNANFEKMGSGKVIWSGANTNTGYTSIREGELAIQSSSVLGTGVLTVEEGATLGGTNISSKPLKNSSFTINGTLRPGLLETAKTGTIFFNDKNVTIGTTGALVISATQNATSINNGCTAIGGINRLTINGKIIVNPNPANTLKVGDKIRIFTATTFAGTPTLEFADGIEWDDSQLSEGILTVKAVSLGVKQIGTKESAEDNIYDIRGRLVRRSARSFEGLPAGIYVKGGKKFVISESSSRR